MVKWAFGLEQHGEGVEAVTKKSWLIDPAGLLGLLYDYTGFALLEWVFRLGHPVHQDIRFLVFYTILDEADKKE